MPTFPPVKVKAKFHCVSVSANEIYKKATLDTVIGTEDDNKDFTDQAPRGNLIIHIMNDRPAANFFTPGKDYYLEFEQAPDQPKAAGEQ